MLLSDKIRELHNKAGTNVEILEKTKILGFIPYTRFHGWLWIDNDDDRMSYNVTLASNKDYHNRAWGNSAYSIDVMKDSGDRKIGPMHLTGVWKQAITMWPVEEGTEAEEIFSMISSKIDIAYEYYKKLVPNK